MKCTVPEISWHNRDPVLSVDFQYSNDKYERLATGGTDSHVLIWHLKYDENDHVQVEFAADLTRHQKAVNIVRFSPNGEILASADDEAAIITWKLGEKHDIFGDDGAENKENWIMLKMLRGHLEDIFDLSWSACSSFLISGSVDNTAIMWDVKKAKNIGMLNDQKGFVQGVAWDPHNSYVATLSTDRQCRIYNIHTKKIVHRMQRATIPVTDSDGQTQMKPLKLFHDDTLKTFCRRLCFTPDGELLITPAGLLDTEDGKQVNTTYVFSRSNFSKPALYLPTKNKYTIAVRCCPVLFELRPIAKADGQPADDQSKPWLKYQTIFSLPYRMVFAVALQDAIIIYDTQQPAPIAHISNCHYTRLSDLTWSKDGRILAMSSTDGYCSLITFEPNELGVPYKKESLDSINSQHILEDAVKASPGPVKATPVPVKSAPTVLVEKNVQSDAQLDKKTPKRVQFITLSSPKANKTGTTFDPSQATTNQPTSSSSAFLKALKPEIVERPIDMDCLEDPTDLKLAIESTMDDSLMQSALADATEEQNKMDVDVPVTNSLPKVTKPADGAPRRVQLITLSKPAK